jgi:hypothetical protein
MPAGGYREPQPNAQRKARSARSSDPDSRRKEQLRVLELMRRRARGSSVAALRSQMQELEREIERLRRAQGRTT